ncbi:unnamed protein product [Sphenostylis stenocarpa]|uniref:Uncharacterized protein n=1 Tax=Sphenostylis stenocarpa TaxID=92480 RepID=A0AA86W2H0_9FABA|nr:unnamed protein product [Sphenostylis stenocarpa]
MEDIICRGHSRHMPSTFTSATMQLSNLSSYRHTLKAKVIIPLLKETWDWELYKCE